jgi:hypothetical protein
MPILPDLPGQRAQPPYTNHLNQDAHPQQGPQPIQGRVPPPYHIVQHNPLPAQGPPHNGWPTHNAAPYMVPGAFHPPPMLPPHFGGTHGFAFGNPPAVGGAFGYGAPYNLHPHFLGAPGAGIHPHLAPAGLGMDIPPPPRARRQGQGMCSFLCSYCSKHSLMTLSTVDRTVGSLRIHSGDAAVLLETPFDLPYNEWMHRVCASAGLDSSEARLAYRIIKKDSARQAPLRLTNADNYATAMHRHSNFTAHARSVPPVMEIVNLVRSTVKLTSSTCTHEHIGCRRYQDQEARQETTQEGHIVRFPGRRGRQ